MAGSEQNLQDNTNVFDYLCVDNFIKNIVDARALGAAFELGIIDYLVRDEGSSIDDLGKISECDGRGLNLLLSLLKTNKVIEDYDGKIRLSRRFKKAIQYRDLLEAKLEFAHIVTPDLINLFTLFIKNPDRFSRNARVFELFAYNRCFDYSPENYELTKRWVRITTALTRYEAQVAMEYHDFGIYQGILDIGGNSGEFALQICRKHPKVLVTVFDLPLVCDIGREHIRPEPEAGRISFVKGNALSEALPGCFDLISFKSVLHDWPEREAKQLILSAVQSLEPGGTLLIFERGPIELSQTTFAYSMIPFLLCFYAFRSPLFYEECLRESGFQEIHVHRIDLEMPFFLVTAKKGG